MKLVKFKKPERGLAALRKTLGYTQVQIAEKLGISRSLWVMAENGHRSLSTPVLIELAGLKPNTPVPNNE